MPMIAVLVSCPHSISYLLRSEMTDGRDRHACWVVTRPDGFAAAPVVHSGSNQGSSGLRVHPIPFTLPAVIIAMFDVHES